MVHVPDDVGAWLRQLGADPDLGPLTEYLAWCHTEKQFSPRTVKAKFDFLRRPHTELLPAGLLLVSEPEMRRWWRQMASRTVLAPNTSVTYRSHLRAFYAWALREDLRADDPTRRIDVPKVKRGQPKALEVVEANQLLRSLKGTREWLPVAIGLYAGLRCFEIANVRPEHVATDDGVSVLSVQTKGRDWRRVLIPAELAEIITAQPRGEPAVRGRYGQPYTESGLSHALGRILRSAGLSGGAHRLRHTYATEYYRLTGGDLRATQEAIGHSSPETTAIYAKADPSVTRTTAQKLWKRIHS